MSSKKKETRKRAKKAHLTRNWVTEVNGNRGLGGWRQKKLMFMICPLCAGECAVKCFPSSHLISQESDEVGVFAPL